MIQLLTVVQGWPEHFIQTYTKNEKLHDHSMARCAARDIELPDIEVEGGGDNDRFHDPEHVLRCLLARMEITSYSTAFSGIDSPGTAYAQMRACIAHQLDTIDYHEPSHFSAIEPYLIDLDD